MGCGYQPESGPNSLRDARAAGTLSFLKQVGRNFHGDLSSFGHEWNYTI